MWLISISNCNWATSKRILCTIIASLLCFVFCLTSANASQQSFCCFSTALAGSRSLYSSSLSSYAVVSRSLCWYYRANCGCCWISNWNYRIGGAHTQPCKAVLLYIVVCDNIANCVIVSYTNEWYRIAGEYSRAF